MSSKIATWGDLVKNRGENTPKSDISEKSNKTSASDSKNNKIEKKEESRKENTPINNAPKENDNWDKSSFSPHDSQGIGVGYSIVCQVMPSQNSLQL